VEEVPGPSRGLESNFEARKRFTTVSAQRQFKIVSKELVALVADAVKRPVVLKHTETLRHDVLALLRRHG
jgi:hypothetical protein